MHRRALKALLAAYRVRWPQESATVARFDAFVDSHPDCSTVPAGSATSHGLGVARRQVGATACSWRTIASSGAGLEPVVTATETPIPSRSHCASARGIRTRRAALDDAIFDIDVHGDSGPVAASLPNLHFDVRFLVQAEDDRFRVSEESHALAWVPTVGLGALTDEESVLRMTRKWMVRRGDRDSWIEPSPTA